MSGQTAAVLDPEATAKGDIEVRTSAGTLRITSVRTPGAGKARLERLEQSFGGIVAELDEQAEAFAGPFRAELTELAGGEMSPSTQVLAGLAIGAVLNVRRAELLVSAALGDWSEARLTTLACETLSERSDKSQRNLAGLAIVARDLMQSARDAAREEGKVRKGVGPVGQLMTRLGVAAGPGPVPDLTPGGGSVGAPLYQNPEHPEKT